MSERSDARDDDRRAVVVVATTAAVLVLFVAALAPGLIASGSGLALLRVPVEAVLGLLVLALLPWAFARRIVAAFIAVLLVAAAVLAALDKGFETTLSRPFNIVTDWPELRDAYGVLSDSAGGFGAAGLVALLLLAVAAALVAVTWALLRIDRVLRTHRRAALIGGSSVTAVWVVAALVGAQLVPGEPVAASSVIGTLEQKAVQAGVTAHDQAAFAKAAVSDPYAKLPASDLLTGLKGKDVIVAFIESYGQVAVQNTSFSSGVDKVLNSGNAQLAKAGYSERSAFLTSPTFGGISWLAHSTLQSGLWVDSQQKYDRVTSSDRFTLSDAFKKAGWRTLSDVPSDAAPWPVGKSFYHYDTLLNSQNVGYQGPRFSYARIPDQFTWNYLQQHELASPHKPFMAEVDFVSSHTPWTPLPHLVPWSSVGDGSVYDPQPAEGLPPSVVWQNPRHVQQLYGESVQYTMSTLFSFLTTFNDPNLVLVVLGDHQPATVVSGSGANHDVPISIISKDKGVIAGIDSWHWQQGVFPSPAAPVWRMDAFRNRFLTAYGPQ
ncbi:CDP-alcohol phosphatidyltransferase [Humibacter sp. RRB41]|uniref:CDP-alcohol phosphatidyltransferase n=1 Tax=Humibacter sp. RRB41 TaxID=2919946 RepID=UPI001FAAAD72|nr:CDP-alcohol phosphatidyltransferase [Humibacter sp. RRB41]